MGLTLSHSSSASSKWPAKLHGIPLREDSLPAQPLLPSFLIIGAAKSGTTSLWHYLMQHPQVFMHSRKQLNFFSYGGDLRFNGPPPRDLTRYAVANITEYAEQFHQAEGKIAIGECSNSYLYFSTAADRICQHLPEVKLLVILRHPAERAYSRYLQLVQSGREGVRDFSTALDLEPIRVRDRWWPEFHYLRGSLYHLQLLPYMRLFERSRLKLLLNDDLLKDPIGTMRSVFEFLGVDPTFAPDVTSKYSVTGMPRNRIIHQLLVAMRAARPLADRYLGEAQRRRLSTFASAINTRNLAKPPLAPGVRNRLIDGYREDTMKLEDILQRDLSSWLV